jgi:predicted ATPase
LTGKIGTPEVSGRRGGSADINLAHLWQAQDKRQDAYDLLAPVYEWFTEGFDTADLQEAKALLNRFAAGDTYRSRG